MKLYTARTLLGILSDCANVSFRQPRQAWVMKMTTAML